MTYIAPIKSRPWMYCRYNSLAKARTSPDGENPTVWTQPPAGLPYSPQMVLKGNLDPHTVAVGLDIIRSGAHKVS